MQAKRLEVPLRIVVEDPVPNLTLALQRGAAANAKLVPPVRQTSQSVVFDFEVTVDGRLPDGRPRLLGPFVHGPAASRFVYICVGSYAGQVDAAFGGRAKVPLQDLDWERITSLGAEERLMARIAGQSSKGGPALATVKLKPGGWTT